MLRPLSEGEFAAALDRLAVFEPQPLIAVGVSGGADSLALTLLADRWARRRGGAVCALSVDHRLRPESGAEITLLAGWLQARGIRHERLVWSGDKPESGLQQAARAARYALLAAWCREHGVLHLLLAHHREDQIETHLIRRRANSGADGLAGMSAVRELAHLRVLRPLLGVSKDRLRAVLAAEGQPFIEDPSNRNARFERVRLRQAGAVSDPAENDAREADIRALGRDRVEREAARNRLLARAVALHPAGFGLLAPEPLLTAEPPLAELALSALARSIGGGRYLPRRKRVARALATLRAGTADGRGWTLAGCCFRPWRGRVLALRELARAEGQVRVLPGVSCLWDCRFFVTLPEAAEGPVTLGYLGPEGVAELGRRTARTRKPALPRLIWPTLPALWDEAGLAAVPHLGYRREAAGLPAQLLFRPAATLTDAGFTVV